jgi:uncharacterized membrane protein
MSRRRSLPWIYRWSRPLIGAIAIVGAILTAYLTVTKMTGGEVVCTADAAQATAGCQDVLNSAYATVFGLPLSFLGFLAYSSMATFALGPLFTNRENHKGLKSRLENWTWLLLLAGGTAMAVFSAYLMYILATELKIPCPYCIGSALFSLSLLILTIFGREWDDLGQIFFIVILAGMVTFVGTLGVYARVNAPQSASGLTPITEAPPESPQPPHGWEITTTSGESEIELAKHLTKIGAKMYGAFWCPHCFEQKQLFGKAAFEKINSVECADANNPTQQAQACIDAKIESYPTWEIKGKLDSGAQLLDKLAETSGYQGPKNFKYTMPGR